MAEKLNIGKIEDWYNAETKEASEKLGRAPFHYLGRSIREIITKVYKETNWELWKFQDVPRIFWDDINNQRDFMESIAIQLDFNTMEDWYQLKSSDIFKRGGSWLTTKYGNMMRKILGSIYPEIDWLPWKFDYVPQPFWAEQKNQRNFLDWLSEELKLESIWDWYGVEKGDISSRGGVGLLKQYGGSMGELLRANYPWTQWRPWLFDEMDSKFWKNKENQTIYLNWVEDQLGIITLEDWYKESYLIRSHYLLILTFLQ
jgi:hypothetical protein